MTVKIRSYEKCRDCNLIFKEVNKFHCEQHDRWARHLFISITKIKNHKDGRERIFSDKNDIPLSIEAAIKLKDEIVASIKDNTFNIKRYLPRSRRVFLFENYKIEYLKKMQWRASLKPGHDEWMSIGHFKGINNAFKNYLKHFNDYDIQNIKKKHVQDWIDELKVSNDYKRKLIGYLSHLLRWAKEREDITVIPKMPTLKFKRKKKKGLLEDAQQEILQYIPDLDKQIFEFLIETGRRINEARAIKVKDLDFKANVYRIGGAFDMENYKPFPKVEGHAEEEYPITEKLKEIFEIVLKNRVYGFDDFIFINRAGHYYKDSGLRKIFNFAKKKAGYSTYTLNVFGRHSKGLQLKMAGATDEEIASILGNTAKIVNETYTHVEAGSKAKILSLLDKRKKKENSPFGSEMAVEHILKK